MRVKCDNLNWECYLLVLRILITSLRLFIEIYKIKLLLLNTILSKIEAGMAPGSDKRQQSFISRSLL